MLKTRLSGRLTWWVLSGVFALLLAGRLLLQCGSNGTSEGPKIGSPGGVAMLENEQVLQADGPSPLCGCKALDVFVEFPAINRFSIRIDGGRAPFSYGIEYGEGASIPEPVMPVPVGGVVEVEHSFRDGEAFTVVVQDSDSPSARHVSVFSVKVDQDGDGVRDSVDNCPATANADQGDQDGDGLGDPCDNCKDIDRDGYGASGSASCPQSGLDCNDGNAAVHPGATEVCGDSVDNDCAGGDEVCCPDSDGDGWGNPGSGNCSQGAATDCNDGNASVHPGAQEVCGDSLDNDCVGGDAACCPDSDGDGWGNPGSSSCPQGSATDCNDGNASVHPGAQEVCGDSVDNDCEGGDLCCCRDRDHDGYGNPGCRVCSRGSDTDCDDDNPDINPGAEEECGDLIDNNCRLDDICQCHDNDGDGYGNPGSTECPRGSEEDCNDNDPDVNPGATERCDDGKDNNCEIDDICACHDNDHDGFGNPGTDECPGGLATDCNDNNPTINPGAGNCP